MKKAQLAVAVTLLLSTAAFAKKPHVTIETDKFTGITVVSLKETTSYDLPYSCGGQGRCGWLLISAAAATKIGTGVWQYDIVVDSTTDTWQFLEGVDSVILVDGQPTNLHFNKGSSQVGNIAGDVVCHERLTAVIDKATLDKIANAKTFEMKFGSSEFTFNSKSIGYFKEFDDQVTSIVGASPVAMPTPAPQASPTPATPEKVAADRKAWLDTINAPGRKGHGDISGDVLTLHSAECNRQNFDLLTANSHMKEVFGNLRIKTFVYTNDLDLTFTYDVVKGAEVK